MVTDKIMIYIETKMLIFPKQINLMDAVFADSQVELDHVRSRIWAWMRTFASILVCLLTWLKNYLQVRKQWGAAVYHSYLKFDSERI